MRARARTKAHRITMPFRFVPSILLTIAFSKDAFPNRRRTFARLDKSFSLPKPARSPCVTASREQLLRKSSTAISGFRSLYGREQHSSSYCAQFDLLLEPFTRRALVSRTLASPASSYGASNPGPMLWPERSRSGGIFQGVFLRSKGTLSGRFVACDCPRNACQIGFRGDHGH